MTGLRLTGHTTILREFTSGDLDAVHAIVGDPRVTDWLSFDARTRDEARAMLDGILTRAGQEPRGEFYLAVEADASLVGFVRLATSGVKAAKLGFAVAADHWGRGYATDAAATMTHHAFTVLGLHRVSTAIGPANHASMAVVTKLGFIPEGRIRDHVHTNGAWRDSILYGVLAHEWTPRG
ncbi:N-acetyltransferase [Actinorhabdospora filicis]|uniref:N-acetyltransferase n=1 Tax=Actinorhabdospora filicis TaxID=1785913 RepID=A0A9W6SP72_9ACTN|nr:GNAT family N-acetyltransferase [Actinorhabdospora filicis]GLZ79606.1 N-acetyltransferase [Actinorhabdospora filicis]